MADQPPQAGDYLALDVAGLLAQCDQHVYRSSGPGGQHRNKVSSAVRLHHRPTGLTAHGDDSRSQHENRRLALGRLRMKLACQLRSTVDLKAPPPPHVQECLFTARGPAAGQRRLQVGARDYRFWHVGAFLLDLLEAFGGKVAPAAAWLGISTGNLVALLESHRHLLGAAQAIRKAHGLGPLK